MYLTGGLYKGQKIEVPSNVQPTLSKVRESVFNILQQFEFKNKLFLNMFSGSGLIGLEAISRGYCVRELEISPKIAQVIKSNYKRLKLAPDLVVCNALNYKTTDKFEIVYLDPPWDMDYKPIIKKASELLSDNGVIFVEYDKQKNIDIQSILDELKIDISLVKSKKYGRCLIAVLKRN